MAAGMTLYQYYHRRAKKFYNAGNYAAAIANYDKAVELKPDDASAYLNRWWANAMAGNRAEATADYDKAIELYDKAVELKPDDASAYLNRWWANAMAGNRAEATADYDKAIELYDKAVELKPRDVNVYLNRGWAKSKAGKQAEAIADYDKAIKRKPKYAEAYYNRGMAEAKRGSFMSAIIDYDKALELKPDYADAHGHRGYAQFRFSRHLRVIEEKRRCLIEAKKDLTKQLDAKISIESREDLIQHLDEKISETWVREWLGKVEAALAALPEVSPAVSKSPEVSQLSVEDIDSFKEAMKRLAKLEGADYAKRAELEKFACAVDVAPALEDAAKRRQREIEVGYIKGKSALSDYYQVLQNTLWQTYVAALSLRSGMIASSGSSEHASTLSKYAKKGSKLISLVAGSIPVLGGLSKVIEGIASKYSCIDETNRVKNLLSCIPFGTQANGVIEALARSITLELEALIIKQLPKDRNGFMQGIDRLKAKLLVDDIDTPHKAYAYKHAYEVIALMMAKQLTAHSFDRDSIIKLLEPGHRLSAAATPSIAATPVITGVAASGSGAAGSGGVSRREHDALKAESTDLKRQIAALTKQLSDMGKRHAERSSMESAQARVSTLEKQLAEAASSRQTTVSRLDALNAQLAEAKAAAKAQAELAAARAAENSYALKLAQDKLKLLEARVPKKSADRDAGGAGGGLMYATRGDAAEATGMSAVGARLRALEVGAEHLKRGHAEMALVLAQTEERFRLEAEFKASTYARDAAIKIIQEIADKFFGGPSKHKLSRSDKLTELRGKISIPKALDGVGVRKPTYYTGDDILSFIRNQRIRYELPYINGMLKPAKLDVAAGEDHAPAV